MSGKKEGAMLSKPVLDAPPVPKELKERYEFTCPGCGNVADAAPSIMMIGFNVNAGHGTCKCGLFLHLEIDESGEKMAAMPHDEWVTGWLAGREEAVGG